MHELQEDVIPKLGRRAAFWPLDSSVKGEKKPSRLKTLTSLSLTQTRSRSLALSLSLALYLSVSVSFLSPLSFTQSLPVTCSLFFSCSSTKRAPKLLQFVESTSETHQSLTRKLALVNALDPIVVFPSPQATHVPTRIFLCLFHNKEQHRLIVFLCWYLLEGVLPSLLKWHQARGLRGDDVHQETLC